MKIFFSLVVAIVSGLILGYIPSKILVALNLFAFTLGFAIAIGFASAIVAGLIADWSRKYMMGTICAIIIGSTAYYNFLYHNYLPIKRNPPEDSPALVALKDTPEPYGFFTYLQIAGDDKVETYGGRRRGMRTGTQVVNWVIDGAAILFVAFFGMTGWVNREN